MNHKLQVVVMIKIDENILLSGGNNNLIKMWNVTSGGCLKKMSNHQGVISCILRLNSNQIISGGYDNKILIWNINGSDENSKDQEEKINLNN